MVSSRLVIVGHLSRRVRGGGGFGGDFFRVLVVRVARVPVLPVPVPVPVLVPEVQVLVPVVVFGVVVVVAVAVGTRGDVRPDVVVNRLCIFNGGFHVE